METKRHAHSLLDVLALLVQKYLPSARSMSSRERAACCGETSRPLCNSLAILSSSNTLAAPLLRQHSYFCTSKASKMHANSLAILSSSNTPYHRAVCVSICTFVLGKLVNCILGTSKAVSAFRICTFVLVKQVKCADQVLSQRPQPEVEHELKAVFVLFY